MPSAVTTADGMMRQGTPLFGRLFIGLLKLTHPVTGTGFSGIVEAIGQTVNQFNEDDAVFGQSIFGAGTNAEYVYVAEGRFFSEDFHGVFFIGLEQNKTGPQMRA